ncbi:hypothetical protein AHF37_07471 [Paragonimus kellicotti]|nr:hypothetical protein AHF37_07471 [Paragonimus kellicotti]
MELLPANSECIFQFVFRGLTSLLPTSTCTQPAHSGHPVLHLRLVEHPENLTKENKTKAQTDVCKQEHFKLYNRSHRQKLDIRELYDFVFNILYSIGKLGQAEQSISEEILHSAYNPGKRQFWTASKSVIRRQWINNNRSGRASENNPADGVTREVHDNVKKQIEEFLNLSNISDNNVHTKPFGDYEDPEYKGYTRMKANITVENSMLAANRINYTCSSFRQLIKACLDSRFFHSETTYIGWPVTLIDEKSDSSLPTETTQSEAPTQASTEDDSKVKDSTSTQGGGDGKSDESTITTNNGSVVTISTTIPGGVGKMAFRYSSIIPQMFIHGHSISTIRL